MAELLSLIGIGFALPQCHLGCLLLVDVDGHAVPFKDLSPLVPQPYSPDGVPSVLTISPSYTLLYFQRNARFDVIAPCARKCREIVRMDDRFAGSAPQALRRQAGVILPSPVGKIE